jgi:hypothetical protein
MNRIFERSASILKENADRCAQKYGNSAISLIVVIDGELKHTSSARVVLEAIITLP